MTPTSSEYAAITQAIRNHQRILVIPHANVDPDGLSSALTCYHVFKALGKDVTVVCPDPLPESMQFLPGFEHFSQKIDHDQDFIISLHLEEGTEIDTLRYNVEDNKVNIIVIPKKGALKSQNVSFGEGEKKYDLIVVVDTADLPLLGSVYTDNIDFFSSVPVINIDHHISNTQFGQLQLIDPTAASATEVLYHWFQNTPELRAHLTADIATLLLTGLITDTRSFQNPNTTPRSLEVAAELLDLGAEQQEIIQHVYKTKPLSTLQIWGRALSRIQLDNEAHIAWSYVSKEDLVEMNASSKETHGILDELISTIPEAEVHVLFTELEQGGLKASMRSTALYNASQLAAEGYGGGGHPRAAGFKVHAFDNFQLQVLECIKTLKEGMKKQHEEKGMLPHQKHSEADSMPTNVPDSVRRTTVAAEPSVTNIVEALSQSSSTKDKPVDVIQSLSDEPLNVQEQGVTDVRI